MLVMWLFWFFLLVNLYKVCQFCWSFKEPICVLLIFYIDFLFSILSYSALFFMVSLLLFVLGSAYFSFSCLLMWTGWIGLNHSSSFFVFYDYKFPLSTLQLHSLSSGMLHFLLIHVKILFESVCDFFFCPTLFRSVFLFRVSVSFPNFSPAISHSLNPAVVRKRTLYGFNLKCIEAFHFSLWGPVYGPLAKA